MRKFSIFEYFFNIGKIFLLTESNSNLFSDVGQINILALGKMKLLIIKLPQVLNLTSKRNLKVLKIFHLSSVNKITKIHLKILYMKTNSLLMISHHMKTSNHQVKIILQMKIIGEKIKTKIIEKFKKGKFYSLIV